jgi:hypothetical protein
MDRERPLINMVSMIDATFLLLSFFLVTSGAAMLEGRLTGALGTATGAKGDQQRQEVFVCRMVAGGMGGGVEGNQRRLIPCGHARLHPVGKGRRPVGNAGAAKPRIAQRMGNTA